MYPSTGPILGLMMTLLVGGCSYRFILDEDEQTCDADFLEWTGGLTFHILQGERRDGSFTYPSPVEVEGEITGDYDLATGEFWWAKAYDADHFRVQTFYSGEGYAWEDGDVDLRADVTETTNDGRQETWRIYERRLGCEVDQRTVTANDKEKLLEAQVGVYSHGQYDYTREFMDNDRALEVQGTLFSDYHWIETLDSYENGTLSASYVEQGEPDGTLRRDFEESWSGSDSTMTGFWEQSIDGSRHWVYTLVHALPMDFDYVHDRSGDGEGTLVIDGDLECSVTLENFVCTYRCGDDALEPC